MNPTTDSINIIKPGQAIQFFLFCAVTIALFLLSTTTNLLQQPEQPNHVASVEMVDGAETNPGAAKQDVLTQPGSSLEPINLMIIKHEMVSFRKLASSLSPDYHKLLPHIKADVTRGADVPLIISSDKAYEVITSLTERLMQKKSKSEMIRRQTRSVLQSDHHQAAASTTHELTASTGGKNPQVDDSAAFHVDYSGPKTHPPKNN